MSRKISRSQPRSAQSPNTRKAQEKTGKSSPTNLTTPDNVTPQNTGQIATLPSAAFWRFAVTILIIGAALRLISLGTAPFSHDEAIHAKFSLDFSDYKYDPVYHGPLLYHLVALTFKFFGDSDFTARFVPAFLGIALLVTALAARRFIGSRASLWSVALLTVSPVIVTYSRRLLHDSLVLVLTLGAVLCFQNAREFAGTTRRGFWARIGAASCLSLLITTKANAFFIIAMLFSFWLADKTSGFFRGGERKTMPLLVPVAALALVAFFSLFHHSNAQMSAVALSSATPGLPQLFAQHFTKISFVLVVIMWEWLRRNPQYSITENLQKQPRRLWRWITPLLCVAADFFCYTFFYGHGYLWLSEPGALAKYWSDVVGPQSAIPKMLKYWGGQQANPRLPGRHDYYIVLMSLYELPILLAAIGGFIHACRHRTPFSDLLLWWAFTSFALYSVANEKVPWLMAHIMLPLAFLAALCLAHWQERVLLSTHKQPMQQRVFVAACALGAVFLGRNLVATNFGRPGDNHEPMFYAQPTEDFRDKLLGALNDTRGDNAAIWVHGDKYWPTVWYVREGLPYLGKSNVQWGNAPSASLLRVVVQPVPEDWKSAVDQKRIRWYDWKATQQQLQGWKRQRTDFIMWPRASWSALVPNTYINWWLHRHASRENGVLSEWSSSPVEIATRK